ncbi:MAG TPA: Lrp/AsnC family transcriptional regulator [Nitrososphaera sp.]|nr:Lrp/AsnC family transcriptional regulator [Nitrososphaera sp.]
MVFQSELLDEINLKIIDILTRDSSRPFVEIAKELQISDATVHMRVRRLAAAGIIRRFTIATDSRLLGYGHLAFMGINMKEGSADEVTDRLSRFDEILEIHEIHGRFDLLLKVRARSLEEMRDIVVNKIRRLPQITDAELMAVLTTTKEEQSVSLKRDISDATAAAT